MSESPKRIWPQKITRGGCTCTGEEAQQAFARWLGHHEKTHGALVGVLMKVCADRKPHMVYEHHRTADAILQIARKNGLIKFSGGKWNVPDA
jgi:hypothetical protein